MTVKQIRQRCRLVSYELISVKTYHFTTQYKGVCYAFKTVKNHCVDPMSCHIRVYSRSYAFESWMLNKQVEIFG